MSVDDLEANIKEWISRQHEEEASAATVGSRLKKARRCRFYY